jgi:integrase/recombinase XerD
MRRRNKLSEIQVMKEQTENLDVAIDFDKAVELFLREARIRNLSGYTTKHYKEELQKFKKNIVSQGLSVLPSDITREIIKENIILFMLNNGRQEKTINTLLGTLITFFNFLVDERYLLKSPMETIKKLKFRKRIIETFSIDQVHQLLSATDKTTFVGVRDHAIMLLFLETGIRANELIHIQLNDIKWGDNVILITEGKCNKSRYVPMQRTMKKVLRKYITIRGELTSHYVFVTIDNEQLSKRQIQDHISKYGKLANITNVRCSPHVFRHSFAKMSVLSGANIFALQAVLGHSTLDVTRNYVNLFTKEVYELHKQFSPVENLNSNFNEE